MNEGNELFFYGFTNLQGKFPEGLGTIRNLTKKFIIRRKK